MKILTISVYPVFGVAFPLHPPPFSPTQTPQPGPVNVGEAAHHCGNHQGPPLERRFNRL